MRKSLCLAALAAASVLMTGCVAVHADEVKPTPHINEDITVRSGYYTCEDNDAYIHVDGNLIELCNFDHEANAEDRWNELMAECDETERERQAPHREEFISNSVEFALEQESLQEFTVYTIPFEERDITMLVLNFDFAVEHGTFMGYNYNEDGSISRGELTYYYAGEELPV